MVACEEGLQIWHKKRLVGVLHEISVSCPALADMGPVTAFERSQRLAQYMQHNCLKVTLLVEELCRVARPTCPFTYSCSCDQGSMMCVGRSRKKIKVPQDEGAKGEACNPAQIRRAPSSHSVAC